MTSRDDYFSFSSPGTFCGVPAATPDDLGDAAVDEFVAETGGEIIERSSVTPSRVVLAVPEGEEDRYVEAYRKLKEVRVAEKNHIFRALPEGGGAGADDAEKYKIKSQ